MNGFLDTIVRQLDPRHDLDNVSFCSVVYQKTPQEMVMAQAKNQRYLLSLPKNILRGGLLGAIAAYAGSVMMGISPEDSIMTGASVGAFLDSAVYVLRSYQQQLDEQNKVPE